MVVKFTIYFSSFDECDDFGLALLTPPIVIFIKNNEVFVFDSEITLSLALRLGIIDLLRACTTHTSN